MSDYIGLALCRFDNEQRPTLFETPAWTSLKEGDRVVVEDMWKESGKNYATVEKTMTTKKTGDAGDLSFILSACGATLPLPKVLAKVTTHSFVYDEEEREWLN